MQTEKNQNNETQNEKLKSEANLDAAIDEPILESQPSAEGEAQSESENLSPDILATMAVMGAAELTTSIYPFLHYDETLKAKAIAKITPLLEKYNVSSPLLNKWKLEIEAGLFFGGVIFASYVQVQQFKALQAAKTVNDADAKEGAGGLS